MSLTTLDVVKSLAQKGNSRAKGEREPSRLTAKHAGAAPRSLAVDGVARPASSFAFASRRAARTEPLRFTSSRRARVADERCADDAVRAMLRVNDGFGTEATVGAERRFDACNCRRRVAGENADTSKVRVYW